MTTPETRPFRPCNGTEGDVFTTAFCDHCRHNNPDPEGSPQCDILTRTMVYDVKDPDYPKEWIQDFNGNNPRCTAYSFHDWEQGEPEEIFQEPPNQIRIPLEPEDLLHNIDMNQTFDEYLGEARDRFVRKIREQDWNTPLRTEAENILIAYDQARHKLQEAAQELLIFHEVMVQEGVTRGVPGAAAMLQKIQNIVGPIKQEVKA